MKRSMIVPAAMAMMLALGAQAQEAPVADDTATEAVEASTAEAADTSDMVKEAAADKASEMADAAEEQINAEVDEAKDEMMADAEDKADEMMADAEEAVTPEAADIETATTDVAVEDEVTEVAAEKTTKTTTVTTAAAPTTTTTIAATTTTDSLDGLTIEELNARQLAAMRSGPTVADGTVYVSQTTPAITTVSEPTTTSSTTYTTAEAPVSAEMTETKPMVMADSTTTLKAGEIERTVLPSGVTRTVTRVVVAEGESGADSYTGSTTSYAEATTTEVTTEAAEATVYAETAPETYEDASETSAAGSMEPVESNTLVDIAAGDATFTTLVSLVQQAELAEALSSEGPFTVFAPTNAAFEGLDADLVSRLTSGTANDELAKVLKGHVVSGTILAADIAEGETTLTTLAGTDLVINRTADGVMAGNAAISSTDIEGSNGVIHVLDAVILPVAAEAPMMEKIVAPEMDKPAMMEEADISADPDMKSMIEDKVETEVEDKVEEMTSPE